MYLLVNGLGSKEGIFMAWYVVMVDGKVSGRVDETLELDGWSVVVSC